ncbi:hypothetical protein TIFTF001_000452 [Ficus carica]|uniref:Factor of DNA methylation 1-5/IDN2 domain-containing protein n=1 Tax=Ficus carica TaxID=3494 RepID=A0AA88CP25_FICCA|nr:hypothetical protein TIFTF001_000452 [Ficus carica]
MQRKNEKLRTKVAKLENLVEATEALELAMERMSSALEVMKHAGDQDEDKDLKKRMDEIREQLDEKEEDLEAMKQLNNDLIVKEKTSSNELYQARMELIEDLSWHPFKILPDHRHHKGKFKERVDEDDETLKILKNEYGDEVHEAVVTALEELNVHNPNGRCAVPELWNFKDERKASLREGIEFVLKQCRRVKRRRNSNHR